MRGDRGGARVGGARPALILAVVIVVGAGLGALAGGVTDGPELAPLVALAVLAVGLAATAPQYILVLALPATLLLARVGGLLSISDVVLAGATAVSILVVRRGELFPMRTLLWAGVGYLASALPSLALNPYGANVVEWAHEAVLILGSLVVGFGVGRGGWARLSVGIYVGACAVIGVAAAAVGAQMFLTGQGFGPVYLPQLHKNTIGGSLAVALILLYAKPAWFRWSPSWSVLATVACTIGILASGARQGMVAALVGLLVVALRRDPDTGRLRLVPWFIAVPGLLAVLTLVNDQLQTGDRYNSAFQRLDWYAESLAVWSQSPIFGVGLRWWYLPGYPAFQPPNAELEVLSSVGVVGLVGFLVMFAVAVVALWRLDPAYGTAAAAVVVARFVQAQFDLFWVAGQASVLWIVAGIAYGALARRDSDPGTSDVPVALTGARRGG